MHPKDLDQTAPSVGSGATLFAQTCLYQYLGSLWCIALLTLDSILYFLLIFLNFWPRLIRVFTARMKKAWVLSYPLSAQQRLIRLGGCPGWSESLLGAQPFCWFCDKAICMIIVDLWTFWAGVRQNQQNDLCDQQRLISLDTIPVWSEYIECTLWVAKGVMLFHVDNDDIVQTVELYSIVQTVELYRLIWVFAGRIAHFVGFSILGHVKTVS